VSLIDRDHFTGHAAIHNEALACDETSPGETRKATVAVIASGILTRHRLDVGYGPVGLTAGRPFGNSFGSNRRQFIPD